MKNEINTKSTLLMNTPLYQSSLVNKSLVHSSLTNSKPILTSNLTSLKHVANSDLNIHTSIKKAKITENKTLISLNKPNLTSLISSLTNTTLNKSISTKSNLLLSSSLLSARNPSHQLHANSGLSSPNLISFKQLKESESKKRRLSDEIVPENVVVEFYENNLIGQEEFLKVDSLINFINNEQKERKEFLSAKRFKTSSSQMFLDNSLITERKTTLEQMQKNALVNLVSSSLLNQPNFKNSKDPTRLDILKMAELVVVDDPEFILKLALYTRRELNIRVTANFLICLAAFIAECRPYLTRYFKASVMVSFSH